MNIFKKKNEEPATEETKEKPTPSYLKPDYPYQATGEKIADLDTLIPGIVYEIKCTQCEMSIRSQAQNIRKNYERLKSCGCIGCGNRELVIRAVDMSGVTTNVSVPEQ